ENQIDRPENAQARQRCILVARRSAASWSSANQGSALLVPTIVLQPGSTDLCVRACRRPDELVPPVARTEFQRRGGTGCVVLSVAESALVKTSETLLARRTSSGLYSAAAPFSGIRWCVFVAIWWR